MKCIAIVILVLAIAFASVGFVCVTAASSAETSAQSEFVPNEVIVGFNEKVTKGEEASTIRKYGGTLLVRNDALNSVLVRVEDEQAFINEISRAPAVKYAEQNGIVHALASKAKKRVR